MPKARRAGLQRKLTMFDHSAVRALSPYILASVLLCAPLPTLAHGSLHARIASLSERIATTPDDKHLYVQRAELEAEHGDLRAAQADLAQARRLDPSWAEVDLVLARCLLQSRRLAQAQTAIAAFRAREPDNLQGVHVEAKVAFELKKWADAEHLYTRYVSSAERAEPDDYLRGAKAISNQGKQHIERALAMLDSGSTRLGEAPVLREYAITLAIEAQDFEGALRRVNDAISVAHHTERWLALKGDILVKSGDIEQGRAAYQASLEAIDKRGEERRQSRALVALRRQVERSLSRLPKSKARRERQPSI